MVTTHSSENSAIFEPQLPNGLTVAEIEDWQEGFLLGAENALRSRPKDDEALRTDRSRSSNRRSAPWCRKPTCCGRL